MIEPLVFLPGMMCDARLFEPQIRAFSATHPVTVAPITHGQRIEEIASNLLSVLPQKFALAGLGLGGIVAMELLRRAPDRLLRVALIDTNCLAETPQAAADREPQLIKVKMGKLGDVMQEKISSNHLGPGPNRAQVLKTVMDMAHTLGPDVFRNQSRALQRSRDQQPTLRKIRQPALVMCGAHDYLCPVKRHVFMAELIPHARLLVLDEAGHYPTLETPDETNDALWEWLHQPYVLR